MQRKSFPNVIGLTSSFPNRNDRRRFSFPCNAFIRWMGHCAVSEIHKRVLLISGCLRALFRHICQDFRRLVAHTHTKASPTVVMGTTRMWCAARRRILDVHRRHLFWNAHIMTFEGTRSHNKLRQGTVASLRALYTRWESHKPRLFFILVIRDPIWIFFQSIWFVWGSGGQRKWSLFLSWAPDL